MRCTMETLKLIGSGYKVLLVKDDVIKYVEPGGLFSSKKNERLFSVYDFERVTFNFGQSDTIPQRARSS